MQVPRRRGQVLEVGGVRLFYINMNIGVCMWLVQSAPWWCTWMYIHVHAHIAGQASSQQPLSLFPFQPNPHIPPYLDRILVPKVRLVRPGRHLQQHLPRRVQRLLALRSPRRAAPLARPAAKATVTVVEAAPAAPSTIMAAERGVDGVVPSLVGRPAPAPAVAVVAHGLCCVCSAAGRAASAAAVLPAGWVGRRSIDEGER